MAPEAPEDASVLVLRRAGEEKDNAETQRTRRVRREEGRDSFNGRARKMDSNCLGITAEQAGPRRLSPTAVRSTAPTAVRGMAGASRPRPYRVSLVKKRG
jgi:3-methyladenine DNA glycosylase Mpg